MRSLSDYYREESARHGRLALGYIVIARDPSSEGIGKAEYMMREHINVAHRFAIESMLLEDVT